MGVIQGMIKKSFPLIDGRSPSHSVDLLRMNLYLNREILANLRKAVFSGLIFYH